ncbi:hypothetical protein AB0I10_18445 [Streptomyces sp. NPDC050636]|uniref:hypothetical protein n=1 Tax=Streptomyces sp. NPDC050636 TaxID=3154510 RepID=UPI0034417492
MTSRFLRKHRYEIQLGVYATQEDVRKLAERCVQLLDGRPWPYRLSVAGQDQTTEPGGMPLTEFYDELPEQWRIEHPGADPGSREIHEIRVGLPVSRQQMDRLREELARVACPDPEHRSPCPIPWSTGYTETGDADDGDAGDGDEGNGGEDNGDGGRYLEQRYGQLRR